MAAKIILKGAKGISLVVLGTLGVILGASVQNAATEKRVENNDNASVVKLPGSKIKLLFPVGYERLQYTNPIKNAVMNMAGKDAAYRKTVDTSENMVLIKKIRQNEAMNPDDLDGLIQGIHDCLADNQGLIEVKNGITPRGYKFIYSIVKNLQDSLFGGVRYFLRLNLFYEKEILEIQADFTEINATGMRESMCVDLARRAGLADISKDGFKDWSKDPYDPEYTKGCLKNLAEKEGLDALFPDNPLTQAHELLLSVLEDRYVKVKRDIDDEEAETKNDGDKDKSREEQEREFLLKIFVDECMRITYPVEVN